MAAEIPLWWPEHKPVYDVDLSYAENFQRGPFFDGPFPERTWKPKDQWIELFGHKVASPLGIPAGPLLNSKWTTLAARLGFDVVTYKTIRSSPTHGHPLPNVVYVDLPDQLTSEHLDGPVSASAVPSLDMDRLAITNSFGMPSQAAEYLRTDIEAGLKQLHEGQLMIVSVVGTPCSSHDFYQDFVETALLAKSAGAKVIEANFSCPNVTTGEGKLYANPAAVAHITRNLVRQLQDVPVVVKMGLFRNTPHSHPHPHPDPHPDDAALLPKVLRAAAEAGAAGVAGINTVPLPVHHPATSAPALGPARLVSGVCGSPIRLLGLDWTRSVAKIIKEEGLGLQVIGCGGIVRSEHFDEYLAAGAAVATSATGFMWDPYLALRWHQAHQ